MSQNCALTLQFTPVASVTPPSPQAPGPATLPALKPTAAPTTPGAPTPSATHPGQLSHHHHHHHQTKITYVLATLGWSDGIDLLIHIMFLSLKGRRSLTDALRGEPRISGILVTLREPMRNPFCLAGLRFLESYMTSPQGIREILELTFGG